MNSKDAHDSDFKRKYGWKLIQMKTTERDARKLSKARYSQFTILYQMYKF